MQHEAVRAIEATLQQDLFCQAGAAGLGKSFFHCVVFCISRNFNSVSIRFYRHIAAAGNSGMMPTPAVTLQKCPCFTKNNIESIAAFTK